MAVRHFFLHNWVASVKVGTNWATDIEASAEDGIEERVSLTSKPRRSVTVKFTGVNQGEAAALFFAMGRITDDEVVQVPLYPDVSDTTALSSVTTVNCLTTDRRFAVGQFLLIHSTDEDGRPQDPQILEVFAVAVGSITTGAMVGSYPAGSVVYPIVGCLPKLEESAVPRTDRVMDWEVAFDEIPSYQPPAFGLYADMGDDFDSALDFEGVERFIFDFPVNWDKSLSIGVMRAGYAEEMGRGSIVMPRGSQPRYVFGFQVERFDRAEFMRLLRFFDGHRGRCHPFFLINPLTLWTVVNVGTTLIDVERSTQNYAEGAPEDDISFVGEYVAIRKTDGTTVIGVVVSGTLDSGNLRIGFDPPIPAMVVGDIEWVTSAHLVRFNSDSMSEEWLTNTVASIRVSMIELTNTDADMDVLA